MSEIYNLGQICKPALDQMPEKHQEIIRSRFGIDNGKIMPLEEVCRKFNISRARMRQLESRFISGMAQKNAII